MEKNNIEGQIIDRLVDKFKNNKPESEAEVDQAILEAIEFAKYISEDWQVDYAKNRIKKDIYDECELYSLKKITQRTINIFAISLGLLMISTFFSNFAFFNDPSFSIPIRYARFLGGLVGRTGAALVISVIIGFILYLIFHEISEKYKKYLDYVAIIFLVVAIITLIYPIIEWIYYL